LQTAFDDGKADQLCIQTVALNYSHHGFGANLFIRVGDTLELGGYETAYREFPAQAVNKLTADMQALFEKNVIHLRKGERTETAESVMRMAYHDHHQNKEGYFWTSRNICEKVADMDDDDYASYQEKLLSYHQNLRLHGLDDMSFSSAPIKTNSNILFLVVALPFYLLGTIIWWIPSRLGKWITDKTVTRIDFYTSVYNGVLGFLGLIWWMIWQIVFWFAGQKMLWLLMFLSPLFCFAALEWTDRFSKQKALLNYRSLLKKDAAFIEQMKLLRREFFLVSHNLM
jgi:hypothetical protein